MFKYTRNEWKTCPKKLETSVNYLGQEYQMKGRQTLLFSATFPKEIQTLAMDFLQVELTVVLDY
jgi:superfamily II DNA/RNA helicase